MWACECRHCSQDVVGCARGGKGCGNIDAKKIKVPAGGDRAARIARYISKYVSKRFEDEPRFNKKRYWASRQSMEEARRYVLNADTLDGASREVEQMLGFSFGDRVVLLDGRVKLEEFSSSRMGRGSGGRMFPDCMTVIRRFEVWRQIPAKA